MATRDIDQYRHKGIKKTHIHRVIGIIDYMHRIYEHYNEDDKKEYVYFTGSIWILYLSICKFVVEF